MEIKLNLRKLVDDIKVMSPLMQDKEKIDTKDLCKYYEKGITVTAIDPVVTDEDEFYVYTFKEKEDAFAYSGYMLTKLFNSLIKECGGALDDLNAWLKNGELKLKLIDKKTKDGKKSYTDFELIEN